MQIVFTNPKGSPVLTCTRDNGSVTYTKPAHGAFFAPHDLMHYAVETTLGLRSSFFGLIAAGRSIPSFADPGAAAMLPAEAAHTEFIVNQFQHEQASGEPMTADDFNRLLTASVLQNMPASPPPPVLTDDQLTAIRRRFAELLHRFRSLGPADRLELPFP